MIFKTFVLYYLVFIGSSLALEVPLFNAPVVDQANLISASSEQSLNQALMDFQERSGNQIAILTIPSLEDEILENFSIKVVDQWQIGNKDKDNGVLFLIAVKNHLYFSS